jgi:L-serine dehydratase
MRSEPYSIFNDIIGPVMTGPSSSHTAAPARIGYMTRHLLMNEPKEMKFEFNRGGSFAATYDSQGTDRGLVGGMMGYTPDNPKMITALEDAKKRNISIAFHITDFDAPHPNTVRIKAVEEDGEVVSAIGISTGGGMIEILNVNGFPVSMTGKYYELLIMIDKEKYDENIDEKIKALLVDGYEYFDRKENNSEVLINIKLSYPIDNEWIGSIRAVLPNSKIRIIPPVFPILSRKECQVPFRTAAEMESWAKRNNYSPWEAGLHYEAMRGGLSVDETMKKMIEIVDIMENSIKKGLQSKRPGKLIKACSGNYLEASRKGKLIHTGAIDTVVAWTMSMVEINSNYGIIVAAPTAGACGTVPGTVLGVGEYLGVSKEEKAKALFAAGAVGLAIAEQATFAAEVCGCQAECGAASSMAAAGVIQLMGGTVEQSNAAASISLQNVLGMICDSVANLVEVPCLGRNVMCAVNAVSTANMVLAGVEPIIPLDEVITSMLDVGKLMPPELCCTNSGGLAITKTSLALAEKISN